MDKISIGFIGSGNMGFAIMRGIAESDLCNESDMNTPLVKLSAYDPNPEQVTRLAKYGVCACNSAKEIMENLDFRSGGPRGSCVLQQRGHGAAHRDKKSTGSFAACAAGGVGRKTGRRRWPYFNGQRRWN